MGRLLVGGKIQSVIKSASETDFQQARGFVDVPDIKPLRGTRGINKIQDGIAKQGTLDVTRNAPLFNDPRYTSSTLSIPTDERTCNGLYRFFTETDPIVGSAVRLQTELPLADLKLGQCEDTGVQQHFEEMWDRINGIKLLTDITGERAEIGNCYPFGAFNEHDYMWDQFAILNPDYVKMESTWVNQKPLIKLIPDEALKKVVHTQSPSFIFKQLPQEIVKYVMFNQEIPLASNNVFHIAHAKRPYELRGRSIIKRILKTLMLEDRFNQANFALATRHAVPITVVKIGDPQSLVGSSFVFVKDLEGNTDILTFDQLWDKYEGIVSVTDDYYETKDIKKHGLVTMSISNAGEQKWSPVNQILRHKTPKEMVKLKTAHADVCSTTAHGFMWLNPKTAKYEEVSPIQLQEREHASIITANLFNYTAPLVDKVFGQDVTTDFVYWLGLWTTDGGLKDNTSYQLTISNKDQGVIDKIYSLSLKPIKESSSNPLSSCKLFKYNEPELKQELIKFYGYKWGYKANKGDRKAPKTGIEKLPHSLLFHPDNDIFGALLAGIIDGDGTVTPGNGSVTINFCTSLQLEHELSLALLSRNITSNIVECPAGKMSTRPLYCLKVSGKENVEKLYELVRNHIAHSLKQIRFMELLNLLPEKPREQFSNSYDFDREILSEMFPNWREPVPGGSKYGKYRLSSSVIEKFSEECFAQDQTRRFYCDSVLGIDKVKVPDKYVYDLSLGGDDHTYLAGGKGWILTHNSGWLPGNEEINDVRDLFASYDLDPNFCYDEETECLTKEGWKKYTELTKEDEIASFNPKGNRLEFYNPAAITIQDYDNIMYHFKSRGMDMMVTPNHRMWTERDGKWQIVFAEDIQCLDRFRTVVDDYTADKTPSTIQIGKYTIDMGDFFELAGWYLSEGSINHKVKGQYYRVNITQVKKESSAQIQKLLNRLPIKWNKYTKEQFSCDSVEFTNFIDTTFGHGSKTKFLPSWMIQAPKQYLERLFESYREGDGTRWMLKSGEYFIVLASQSEKLIDAMQEIALRLGYGSGKRFLDLTYNKMKKGKFEKKNTPYRMFYLNVTKGKSTCYPEVPHRLVVAGKLPKTVSVPEIITKDNLIQLFTDCGGVLSTVATQLDVDMGTVTAWCEKLGIDHTKLRNWKVRGGKIYEPKHVEKVHYRGKIWCVSVPTGIIVTRRNGRVAIQGQTLFYHYGINIEFYGSNGKMLPVGPELDRLYRLKFIGLNMHEQLMTGGGGSYSAAYINLEVQRQRYLNLQLQLETFYHQGVCKPVADLCGFYRIKQPMAGYGGVSSSHYGNEDSSEIDTLKQSSTLRDAYDNREFKEFQARKLAEIQDQRNRQVREYVYPKLDWGAMNAATDENLKNWVKYLAKERPWLVDDATLARLGRLDRDTQEKAYVKDLERAQERYKELAKKGLLPFALQKGQGAGGADMSGIGDIGLAGGGGADMGAGGAGPGMEGGLPNAPTGVGGPPESVSGQTPPTGVQSSLVVMEDDMWKEVRGDDIRLSAENQELLKKKKYEDIAILKVVNR